MGLPALYVKAPMCWIEEQPRYYYPPFARSAFEGPVRLAIEQIKDSRRCGSYVSMSMASASYRGLSAKYCFYVISLVFIKTIGVFNNYQILYELSLFALASFWHLCFQVLGT